MLKLGRSLEERVEVELPRLSRWCLPGADFFPDAPLILWSFTSLCRSWQRKGPSPAPVPIKISIAIVVFAGLHRQSPLS